MASTFFEQVGKIQAGETVGPVTLSYADFKRSDSWSLNCILLGQTGKEAEVAAANGDGTDDFKLTLSATVTGTIAGGRKAFVIEAVHATHGKIIAERGTVIVLPNPRSTTAEMTILTNIRAVMTGLASDGQQTTSLDGVQLRHMTPEQLAAWESRYIKIVNAQLGRAGGNGGVYAIKQRVPQDNRYAGPWYGQYPAGGVR